MMFKKWCEITSCNGVIDLYECKDNKKHFTFWTFVMTFMVVCSIWFTYRTIAGYLGSPTVTNVGTVTDPVLDLPEVLISYNGGINVPVIKAEGFSEEFIQAFAASYNYHNQKALNYNKSLENELESYLKKNKMGYVDIAKKFGYRCEDIIVSVAEPDLSVQTCNTSKLFITTQGNSFVFRSRSAQWYPGLWGGYNICLKAPKYSYVQTYLDKFLALNMNDEFTITLEKSMGHYESGRSYAIPLNSKVEITLNTKLYHRMNQVRPCSSSTELVTSNTCFTNCWFNALLKCSDRCLPVFAFGDGQRYNQSQICNPLTFSPSCSDVEENRNCNKKCLPLCNEWLYEPTIAYSKLAPVSNNDTLSIVVVAYGTMQYTKIEEVTAFTIDMAVSNVGGQAGLWMGISFVTIIQAIYYMIISLFRRNGRTSVSQCKLNNFQN